jgi:hypothetical protein
MASIEKSIVQKEIAEEFPKDLVVVALVLLNVALIALDLYTHPHQGVADLEKRQMLETVIGDLVKHLGNYGFSSCLAISAVFMKKGFDFVKKASKEINAKFVMRIIATITLLNITVESFSSQHGNNQFVGDVSLGFLGAFLGTLSAVIVFNRLGAKRATNLL